MKFQANSRLLSGSLNNLKRVILSKNTLPVLDNFLLELEGDELKITASDSEVTATSVLSVSGTENGKVCVASTQLTKLLSVVEDEVVGFEEDKLAAVVKTTKGKFDFVGVDPKDYPIAPEVEGGEIELPTEQFISGLEGAALAIASDPLRPVMTGVYVDFTEEGLVFVGSDGHKLVKITTDIKVPSQSFIITQKAIAMTSLLLSKEAAIKVKADGRNISLSNGTTVITARMIEGRYPAYNSVIPQSGLNDLKVDRKKLIGAIKRVSVFGSAASNLIALAVDWTGVRVSAQDIDYSTSAEEAMEAEYGGNVMKIGFKGDFLLSILGSYSEDNVTIGLIDPSRAAVVTAEGSSKLSLIMPMMLS